MSISEAEAVLAQELSQYLRTVAGLQILTFVQLNEVKVVGHVKNPGVYRILDEANLPDLIASAGGALPKAQLNRVEIRRLALRVPVRIVNYERFLFSGDSKTLPRLRAGDTIFIPKGLGEVNTSESMVHVLGFVRYPGNYEVASSTTILDILAFAGGSVPEADTKHIKYISSGENGSRSKEFDLEKLENTSDEMQLIRPGDTIIVPRRKQGSLKFAIQMITSLSVVANAYYLLRR